MNVVRRLHVLGFISLVCLQLCAQKQHRETLTEPQIEQIREAGAFPDDRVRLYTKFLEERVETIKGLTNRGHSAARAHRLDNEFQDLTALMDELGSNLDQYGERKADMRKALKVLNESAPRWLETIKALPSEPGFDLSRKEALESGKDLADQVALLFKDQTDYFATHKDEKGQDRAEPQ